MEPVSLHNTGHTRRRRPAFRERLLSCLILALLGFIGLYLFAVQSRFDAGRWRAQGGSPTRSTGESGPPTGSIAQQPGPVAGLRPLSLPETFDAATLSDKIDGKAELYLAAGFKSLETRRFALISSAGVWIEQFVYDMGSYANAFAVYSQQRRSQARPLSLTPDAYASANGLFLVQGVYYVELIGSESSPAIAQKMDDLAERFVNRHPTAAPAQDDERRLFPEAGRVPESIALVAANAFGFDRFNHLYTARYRWADQSATAFVSRRGSPSEAADLANAYVQFLMEYGGEKVRAPGDKPPVTVVHILDGYEVVFHHGDLLGGVHEATDLDRGVALARQLYQRQEAPHER